MGSGRGATTLLECLLAGYLADARALGEVETAVTRGIRYNELCTCREPARRCPEWADALERLRREPGGETGRRS